MNAVPQRKRPALEAPGAEMNDRDSTKNSIPGYGAEQTGKREWRARVWYAGRWHWIGCRDNQHDAMKTVSKVYWSLRGEWSGQPPTEPKQTEELPKVPAAALGNSGSSRNEMGTRYPSIGAAVTAPINGHACVHCGGPIFGRCARFCSPACKQAAYRTRMRATQP